MSTPALPNHTPYKNAQELASASRRALVLHVAEGEDIFPNATLSHLCIGAANDADHAILLGFAKNLGEVTQIPEHDQAPDKATTHVYVKLNKPITSGDATLNWLDITGSNYPETGPHRLVFADPLTTDPVTENSVRETAFAFAKHRAGAAAIVAAKLTPRSP